jgi:hypothetical protein
VSPRRRHSPAFPARTAQLRPALAAALLAAGAALGCSSTPPPAQPAREITSGDPIVFEFAAVGQDDVVSSESTRGRATALVFITTFDLASQVLVRRLGELIPTFTPRANAAAVVIEAPLYAELLPTYRESMSLPFPVVMADFATQRGGGPFGNIERVPVLVVLDREGREVFRAQGSLEASEIEAALRRGSGR